MAAIGRSVNLRVYRFVLFCQGSETSLKSIALQFGCGRCRRVLLSCRCRPWMSTVVELHRRIEDPSCILIGCRVFNLHGLEYRSPIRRRCPNRDRTTESSRKNRPGHGPNDAGLIAIHHCAAARAMYRHLVTDCMGASAYSNTIGICVLTYGDLVTLWCGQSLANNCLERCT